MKHAILILAHKNLDQLCRLIDYFHEDCDVFIHIDRSFNISEEQYKSITSRSNVIMVYRTYDVRWGGYNILRAELLLLNSAKNNSNASYFHLLSGEDFPIKPLSYFLNYFSGNNLYNYILVRPIRYTEAYERFRTYSAYDFFDFKTRRGEFIINKINKIQRRINLIRNTASIPNDVYIGSQWFSITRKGVDTILNYTNNKPSFFKRLRFTFACDEVYIQTILHNLLLKECVCNNNLRLILWENDGDYSPEYLTEKKFVALAINDGLFARKFDFKKDPVLFKNIEKYLLDEMYWQRNKGFNNFCNIAANKVIDFCKTQDVKSVVDIQSGLGLYLTVFLGHGISTNGFNKHADNNLMKVFDVEDFVFSVDISDEITVSKDDKYDMVFCSDVSIFYDTKDLCISIKNIYNLTNQYFFLLCNGDDDLRNLLMFFEQKENFSKYFTLNIVASQILNTDHTGKQTKKIFIFEKK
ncbi:MAG: hypothetical protein IKO36_07475 [Bacteroidaceae bacterium]|nr:hypothetical protein [Bacteroidaceae bacterium]